MTKHEMVLELREEIAKRLKRMDIDEEFVEEAYHRIDQLSEEIQREKLHTVDYKIKTEYNVK